jgi:uncharacterized protein YndB with AHSA1/START domain
MPGFPRLVALPLLLAAAVMARPASADVKDSSPSGFTIENSVLVPVSAATAWSALVNDVDLWWPKDHSWWGRESKLAIDARAGGCFCEIAGDRQAQHLQVVFVSPPTLLRLNGALGPMQGMGLSGVLEWRLQAADGGTRITLWYRVGGYSPDDLRQLAPVVDRVQGLQLGGLANYLNEKSGKPRAQKP